MNESAIRRKGGANLRETVMHGVFFLCALASILAVALICIFLFANGIPAIKEIGLLDFLTGTTWKPGNDIYGILPMIVGSIYITAGAIIIGVPIGLLTAIFMAFYCPKRIYGILKPCTELLAGIPSIVYGFFGMVVIVPTVLEVAKLFGSKISSGSTILSASILLGIMILPTIIGVSEAALRAVPSSYYEGAVAMGARHERAVFSVMLPAAKSGVLAGIVLGVGRAIGETMAVIMVAGNVVNMPSILGTVRLLTTGIVMEMSYSSGLHRQALFAIGLVLFVFIMIVNISFTMISRKGVKMDAE